MGILTRFKDIMASNINALLDKAEDPEKMIDQMLRNANKDLKEVTEETAAVMADHARAQREYANCKEQVERMQNYAMKAVAAGNDDDAKKFLERKNSLSIDLAPLEEGVRVALQNADQMRAMVTKLRSDIQSLESKQSSLKAKLKTAEAKKKMAEIGGTRSFSSSSVTAFSRLEEKVNAEVDKANAMAELMSGPKDDVADLASKYDEAPSTAGVEDELAALKAMMGK